MAVAAGLAAGIGCGSGVVDLGTGGVGTGGASTSSGSGPGGNGGAVSTSSTAGPGGAGGAASTSASSTSSATSASSAASSGTTVICTPGDVQPCYSGPAGTQNVGICKAGSRTCNAGGTAFGACTGEVLPQPIEDCSTPADDNCNGSVNEACVPGAVAWMRDDGSSSGDIGLAIGTDPAGNVFVGGMQNGGFTGTAIFSGSALVLKRSGAGASLWSKTFSAGTGGKYAVVRGLAADSTGRVIAVGEFVGTIDFGGGAFTSAGSSPDAFVVALDQNGNHLWSHAYGDSQAQVAEGVAVDAAGNVFVTGKMAGTVDFGGGALASAGGDDAFVVKLSASGQHLWSKRYGDVNSQVGWSVAVTPQGDIVVTGEFGGSMDFGGGTLTATGQPISSDVFVAKLQGANGNQVWAKRYGDGNPQQGYRVAVDPMGNAVLAVQLRGSIDFGGGALTNADPTNAGSDVVVAKLDANGNYLWAKRYGDAALQTPGGVAVDAAGNVALAGLFKGTINFGGSAFTDPSSATFDGFAAKLAAADGSHVWSYAIGDSSTQQSWAVSTDASGAVFVTGMYQGSITLGAAGTITSQGGADLFTIKFAP
ncbi:MAG: hypothetical protein QM820_62935 [Minicystis sp.]